MPLDLPRIFARFAWALYMALGTLYYLLGVGIAQYLGSRLQLGFLFLGLLWVLSLILFVFFLYRHFDERTGGENLGRLVLGFLPWKQAMLTGAVVAATVAASAVLVLIQQAALPQGVGFLMVLGVVGASLYAVPPARLATSGYGELLLAVLLGAGVPALGFMLQSGGYQRLLAMVAFPLAALLLAMQIALSLPGFATQQKYEINTLLRRMGWENAMLLHNLLILAAFLLVAIAWIFDFPSFAVYPLLAVFPLGLLEVYYMLRIAGGMKPNWNALAVFAAALAALPAYVLALAFWTH